MKRRVFVLVIAIFLIAAAALSAQDKTYTIRFNTVASPSDIQVEAMNKFAEVATALSGGKLDVKVFHSGQLGDQKTALLGVMKGSLEMACDASPAWLADIGSYPEIGVLEVAYLFRDIDHMYRVLNGPVGQKYWDTLAAKSGIRVLDAWYLGTRELSLTKKAGPVRTPADLKPLKIRWPNSEAWLDVGRSLGANPTPMGFGEVYMALKTGTIDGQDNPIPTSYAEKFLEVAQYIVLTDHMLGYVTPVINEKLWKEMPENYRFYIKQALTVARFYMNQKVMEEEATLIGKAQKEYGIQVIVPDKKAFMDNAKKYYSDPKFAKRFGDGAYAKIQAVE
ncbi:MAG TPA: DctP family TRAP transporter solute-binding subunit [Spirochaetales bacterium]|nr:DctP family TRAP transporter solute-binding subunit [Spirochaetales bacterium]